LRLRGRVHSRRRDRQAIAHHYDLSNALYTLLLGDSVAYSCGYWTSDAPDYGLDDAQRDKLDLICRKLDLRPGLRLLDVGCGWGALAVHAARHYGAQVVGVTLSAQQLAFGRERVAREGLDALVDLRLQDYRDLPPTDTFDTVTAIEMGEHVGKDNYPSFLARLHAACRPGGRLLVQQMSRSGQHPAETLQLISTAGFEVRDVHAMREHYVRTIRAWLEIFENRLDDVVSLVGPEQARVWRLYLAGGALAFEANRMGVDQILAVRTPADGGRGVPTTRREWEPVGAAESVEQ
jgi:cyclopropane-fatty-acyl-phospholipid synthase